MSYIPLPLNAGNDAVKTETNGVTTQPVSGTFWQTTQPVSLASMPTTPVTGTFWQSTQPVSLASMPTTPVTGTFWQATQPVSGPLTDTQLRASAVPVSGTFFQATQPVSLASMPTTPVTGTFWQSTQPVSLASMPTTPVTGTFWQSTQPVSLASMPTTPVTGTFWQSIQPVSGTVAVSNAFALDASVTGLQVAQGSTTSGQSGPLAQTATTTNAPTYVTAKTNPLSTDTSGNLRVSLKDSPANTNKFLVTADPITFASPQHVIVDSAPTTAVTGPITDTQIRATPLPVSGPLTDTQIRATALPVSITNLDVALSTRLKPADTLAGVTTVAAVTAITNALPAGTNLMGKVGIDQTTPGTTNKIAMSGATGVTLDAADNAAAPVNSILTSGLYNTTIPALTSGNAAAIRLDSTGAAYSNFEGRKQTYSVAVLDFAPLASATNPSFSVTGSATKTIRITKIGISATAGTGGVATLNLRRFSALSGGTAASQAANIAKHDSTNASATAVVNTWSVISTTATNAGILKSLRFEYPTPAVTVQPVLYEWFFGDKNGQALVLRGTSEFVGICFSAIATTPVADIYIEWTEE